MKLRRIICMVLSVCVALSLAIVPLSVRADAAASYFVRGEVKGGTFIAHVYVRGASCYGGRLALAYDKRVMEPADTSSVYNAAEGVGDVAVTPEGHDASVLLGDGHALFAWYVDSGELLDAGDGDVEIARIPFLLKDGKSADDFNRNTLGMYYVNETMVYGWTCSAEIVGVRDDLLVAYRNTAVKDEYLCDVAFEYPNSDVIPIEKYDVNVHVKNNDGKSLVSNVKLGSVEAETDIYGEAVIPMVEGAYFYRVTSPGYEVKTGYFIVDDSGEKLNVELRSYGQLAYDTVNSLEIGYAEGDSENGVYGDLVLPTETEYGPVTWSCDSSAVNEYGGVRHGDSDEWVTLTATAEVEGVTMSREFKVNIKSRQAMYERNASIVALDVGNVEIGYAPGDSAESVTVDVKLSEAGDNGSTISWESDNESIVYSNGHVTRPEYDTDVTLTAYIMKGNAVDTKKFTITVKGVNSTAPDAEAVQSV
ncbi:MAG: hypothetical protein IJP58_05080, partial [Clostridia bacterium]|nr:hypothetical protein [Clostridia bacterium]